MCEIKDIESESMMLFALTVFLNVHIILEQSFWKCLNL